MWRATPTLMLLTTPNMLTLGRIATVPLIIMLLLYPGPLPSAIAAVVFLVASITDFLDGYIARNYDSGTTLGKFLDPMADKLVVTSALIMLAGMARIAARARLDGRRTGDPRDPGDRSARDCGGGRG